MHINTRADSHKRILSEMGVLIGIFIHIPVGFKDTHTEKGTVCFSLSITFRHGHGNDCTGML